MVEAGAVIDHRDRINEEKLRAELKEDEDAGLFLNADTAVCVCVSACVCVCVCVCVCSPQRPLERKWMVSNCV